jgi:YgiT-type zinc finger domain-containing protein
LDRSYEEEKMKCVICKGSDIKSKVVDEQIRTERDIVLVTMNVLVCSSCGERYYDKKAMKKIEEIRSRLKKQDLEVKEVGKIMRVHAA